MCCFLVCWFLAVLSMYWFSDFVWRLRMLVPIFYRVVQFVCRFAVLFCVVTYDTSHVSPFGYFYMCILVSCARSV